VVFNKASLRLVTAQDVLHTDMKIASLVVHPVKLETTITTASADLGL
jgi:hypothetical protein